MGAPTGTVTFLDGSNRLGAGPLVNGLAAVDAILTQVGIHNVTAQFSGDGVFLPSTDRISLQVTASADFSLEATPSSATVIAGQSTQFMLTVTPTGGFADNVTFSCVPVTGITCAFNPATVTPANRAANTTLTVTTSATVPRYGLLMPDLIGPWALLAALVLFSLVIRRGGKLRTARASLLTASAAAWSAPGGPSGP